MMMMMMNKRALSPTCKPVLHWVHIYWYVNSECQFGTGMAVSVWEVDSFLAPFDDDDDELHINIII